MKLLYNKNDRKEMKAFMVFEPVHNGKRVDFQVATLSSELSMLYTSSFQNHT